MVTSFLFRGLPYLLNPFPFSHNKIGVTQIIENVIFAVVLHSPYEVYVLILVKQIPI